LRGGQSAPPSIGTVPGVVNDAAHRAEDAGAGASAREIDGEGSRKNTSQQKRKDDNGLRNMKAFFSANGLKLRGECAGARPEVIS